jgi:hypothetical protein
MFDTQSFNIGEAFEKYVEQVLFPTDLYDLIHRTNNYEQNKERYAEETLRPDFKFRCKKTQQEFYVEAKYRSRYDALGKIEIAHLKQFRRFEEIVKEEKTPVYFVVGIGGQPDLPETLSLFSIQVIEYLSVYKNFLFKHQIAAKPILNDSLDFSIAEHYDFNHNVAVAEPKKSKTLWLLIPIAIVFFSLLFFYNKSTTNTEEELKKQVELYYDTVKKGNVNSLHNFINPVVDNWYNKYNVSLNEIKRETKKYNRKYPDTEVHIIWDTFNYMELDDKYNVEYELFYKINTINKKYHLRINVLFNKDLKIESIKETKL